MEDSRGGNITFRTNVSENNRRATLELSTRGTNRSRTPCNTPHTGDAEADETSTVGNQGSDTWDWGTEVPYAGMSPDEEDVLTEILRRIMLMAQQI